MWDLDGETWGKGGEYFYTDDRSKTPWGDTRPDYGRREVRDYIKDNAMMWLRDYHVDGLRFDATSFIRNDANGATNPDGWSLMKEINDQVNREFPQKIVIAEDMGGLSSMTNPSGAGFDSQWDPNFVHPIRKAVTTGNDADINMYDVAGAITAKYNGEATQRVIYSESHDEAANGKERLPSTIGGWDSGGWHARKKSTLASALTLTSPGIPMLLQGQELNEDGHFDDGDPINWAKGNEFPGIVDMHRDLIRLRRNWYNNTQGLQGNNVNTFHINNTDKVLGFHRWDQGGPGDDTIVISNMSGKTFHNYELGLPSDGTWKIRFNSDAPNYSPDFGSIYSGDINAHWGSKDGMPARGSINLPPYTTIILSKDR
jgi:1,4-alpha-glucan branching enzyme